MPTLSTVAAFGFADYDPLTVLPLYRRLGCRSSQFLRNSQNPPDPADVRRRVEDLGMPFDSMHGLFGPEIDISSPNPAVRSTSLDVYRGEGELALELGGPLVVVHPGPTTGGLEPPGEQAALRIDPIKHAIDHLGATGEQLGVTYTIENLPGEYRFGHDPVQIADLVRQAGHPNVHMCFDTGHAHMTTQPAAALEHCLDVITYVHLHDNDGHKDSHLVPGEGTCDFDAIAGLLNSLPDDVPIMLELFESVASLTRHIESGLADQLRRWLPDVL